MHTITSKLGGGKLRSVRRARDDDGGRDHGRMSVMRANRKGIVEAGKGGDWQLWTRTDHAGRPVGMRYVGLCHGSKINSVHEATTLEEYLWENDAKGCAGEIIISLFRVMMKKLIASLTSSRVAALVLILEEVL